MDYKDINDYELVYRIRENNDEDSVNVLVKKYEPVIAKYANKYFLQAKYQGVDMNDLMQEGRIAVIKALNSYDPDSTSLFYTYVVICIYRHLITYCRNLSATKHSALNYSVSDECLCILGDMKFEPFYYLTCKYEDKIMNDSIKSLDFLDSNIFELRYNGFSYKEIGILLDISISVVSRRLCKIKQTLQVVKDKF